MLEIAIRALEAARRREVADRPSMHFWITKSLFWKAG
jgi:hypothetical protein